MFFKGQKRHSYSKHTQLTFVYQTREARDQAANLLYRDTWFYVSETHPSFNAHEFSFWVYEYIQCDVLEIAARKTGAIGIQVQEA